MGNVCGEARQFWVIFTSLALVTGVVSGCSRVSKVPELVHDVQVMHAVSKPRIDLSASAPGALVAGVSIQVTAEVNKQALLSQEFLYGSDLQYSSFYFKDYDLYFQSLAMGHIPARFRIVGDELQLVADNRRLFPSDVNHPEQLLSRFKIIEDRGDLLKITTGNAGPYLELLFTSFGVGTNSSQGGSTHDSWIRSFEYITKDQLILQETSIQMPDGTIGEFMESIMPAAVLAPGASFEKIVMDPDDLVGAQDGAAARWRFLKGESIFDGEKKLTFAQHFDISAGSSIDWYVTPNIPDEYIEPVRLAVVGWNRYFKKFTGIERDVVRFMGRLPAEIHLGDPRFNVINWDSRLIAGAAYESQAADPRTGKQSHSLIYMPAAWVTIGQTYWENGQYSDPIEAVNHSKRLGQVSCVKSVRAAAALLGSGRVMASNVQDFGKELLKGVLFHELGHALGLAHNFKGSLSFDRSQANTIFSTSIMDYNDYEVERQVFDGVGSADGPELEYDRQALSALYNQMKDTVASALVPACNDDEADQEDGGVDPLCIRYDIEKDPTLSVDTAWRRIWEPTLERDVSLAQALKNVVAAILTDESLQALKNENDLSSLQAKLTKSLEGPMKFYVLSGTASLSKAVRTNIKSLLVFADGVLSEDYSEVQMRERAFVGIQRALGLFQLPDAVKTSLAGISTRAADAILRSPYVQSLSQEAQAKVKGATQEKILASVDRFEKNTLSGLPRLRELVLAALVRHPAVPFFFGNLGDGGGAKFDFETAILGILGDTVGDKERFTPKERVAAAKSLVTYRGRLDANDMIHCLGEKLRLERKIALDNVSRENAQAILTVLGTEWPG